MSTKLSVSHPLLIELSFGFFGSQKSNGNRNFVPLPPFYLTRASLKKMSKNTVRVTSFQTNSAHARGKSGRMEIFDFLKNFYL